jgi:hypothetical protein
LFFDRCPYSHVYNDRVAADYLAAYALLERWHKQPPGPDDPRYWEAMVIIASEHNAADADDLAEITSRGGK